MSSDCRNDCVEWWQFPPEIENRPGLDRINYRIGMYADFREALLRKLDREPVLAAWTHREADDPGIALLEGAAILGDILTFYQELYANEAYLPTAKWRESIADLVRLLGYRLSPGLGGKATFAFGIKGNQPVVIPAKFPLKAQLEKLTQPADFETLAEFTAIPALSQFYLYRPFDYPAITNGTQKFSVETAVLSEMKLKLNKGDRLLLAANFTDPKTSQQIVVITEINQHLDLTEITIEGSWQSGSFKQLTAYKLGRSFRYFGYNAPPTVTVVQNGTARQDPVYFIRKVGSPPKKIAKFVLAESRQIAIPIVFQTLPATSSFSLEGIEIFGNFVYQPYYHQPEYHPPLSDFGFPLAQEVKDISVGSTVLVSLELSTNPGATGTKHFLERKIANITTASATHGALTGGTTVIELNQSVAVDDLIYTDIRTVEFQEVIGKKFTLKNVRSAQKTSDKSHLYFYGDAASYQPLNQRALQLVRGDKSESVVVSIDEKSLNNPNRVTLRSLTLNPQLQSFTLEDFDEQNPTVTVYGNLVPATQGKTEREAVLGNGDNRQIFQTFKLPKSPLTYFNSQSETPPEIPELEIYVNDRLWQRVPSFFGRKPNEEIYIVREDANNDSWVQFGNDKTGAKLPSGIGNIIAKYRTGIGGYGSLKEGTQIQASARLDRLDRIWLPTVVSGGSQPETGENAKEAAPGKIQSLGRLVSLQDFEQEAIAISGVSKVLAQWQLVDNVPAVVLTVLMENGREKEISEVRSLLNRYNRCRGPQRFPICVYPGKRQYVYLDVTVNIDPTFREELVIKAIKTALGVSGAEGNGIDGIRGLFGIHPRQFGQKEYATRIEGTIQNVAGVKWAQVTALGFVQGKSDDPIALKIPAAKTLDRVLSIPGDRILNLHHLHLQISPAAMPSQEVC